MNLERSGVPVSIFLDQPSFHPCKELYGVNQKGNCPWHAYLTPSCADGGACAVPDSTVANLSSGQFNHFDTKCDEECEYFF